MQKKIILDEHSMSAMIRYIETIPSRSQMKHFLEFANVFDDTGDRIENAVRIKEAEYKLRENFYKKPEPEHVGHNND